MHGTGQSGGRSPKPGNGLTSTLHSRSGSDNGQISSNSFHSHLKGKKRERGDHGAERAKRECLSRTDDGDYNHCRTDSNLKSEIAKITEKGGLVELEGVEKLVQLMQPDKMERKMDLISRSMLASVLAATDKFDCRNQFVQLRGLLVLDEWLQDIHKGKLGDIKDGGKSVEDFLLVLLRALDKLPVNLHALQMCNIGRSVNHLRSHKNLEIQKRARSLVDTWKKRVEAEMNSIDAKSGSVQAVTSWPSKGRLPEASHGVSRNPSGSDVAMKSSITQVSASKTNSVKSPHGESNTKSPSSSPGPIKSVSSPASGAESQPRGSAGSGSDVPTTRDDKSSTSVQSHNYSQSLSVREDGKGSAAGLVVSKNSTSGSRHRKSTTSFHGTSVAGGQKETSSSRSSSLHRNTALDKTSQTSSSREKVIEMPITEGSNHKLIVKIPNRVRSPAPGASGGSLEDPSVMSSRASSPMHSEKSDQVNRNPKGNSGLHESNVISDVNTGSLQKGRFKDVMVVSNDGASTPASHSDEEKDRSADPRKMVEVSQRNDLKSGKLHKASYSPMNALVESCAKYSEANSSISLEDDIGMNLLASVATREMSRSDLVSSTDSPERSAPEIDEACTSDEVKSKPSPKDQVVDGDNRKQVTVAGSTQLEDGCPPCGSHPYRNASSQSLGDAMVRECSKDFDSASMKLRTVADTNQNDSVNVDEPKVSPFVSTSGTVESVMKLREQAPEEKASVSNGSSNTVSEPSGNILRDEDKVVHGFSGTKDNNLVAENASATKPGDGNMGAPVMQESANSGFIARGDDEELPNTSSDKKLVSENGKETKLECGDVKDGVNKQADRLHFEKEADKAINNQGETGVIFDSNDMKSGSLKTKPENEEFLEQHCGASPPKEELPGPAIFPQETQRNPVLKESKLPEVDEGETKECTSAAPAPVLDSKLKFDLNERFTVDDAKYGEPANFTEASSVSTVHIVSPLPFAVSSVSTGFPASITVAAAAKGPFVPPDDLLRSKGELGWKGSAATSAFRPAEPRKFVEASSINASSLDDSSSRQGRPLLDFDLNVPGDGLPDDVTFRDSNLASGSTSNLLSSQNMIQNKQKYDFPSRGFGMLDLDLNRVDEVNEIGQGLVGSSQKSEAHVSSLKLLGGLPSSDVKRDFDLNDGPGVDDASVELSFHQQSKGSIPPHLPTAGLRMSNSDIGNFSSWFPPGNTYSTVTIPSMLPDRGDQSFPVIPPGPPPRIFGPSSATPFTSDVYRGSVMPPSPAVSFPSSPFQYPVFPFGTTFPLPSTTFSVGASSYVDSSAGGRLFVPPANTQLLGPVGAVSSQFPRPYVVNLSEGNGNGGLENSKRQGRQGLDLNAGPGVVEAEAREEVFPQASRHISVASSHAIAEEQARIYPVSGGVLKRKDPEGGWNNENFRYRQPSWQ